MSGELNRVATTEFPSELEEVRVLRVQPGGIVVLKTARLLSAEEMDRLLSLWREVTDIPIRLVVLDQDDELSVLRKDR